MTRSSRFFAVIIIFFFCRCSISGNHYDLLSVPKDADAKEIKKSYRKLALELHPDKLLQQNLTVEEIENKTDHFILVQEAYETLSDDRKRFLYDSTLSGVNTDIIDAEPASYTLFPFTLLARTRRFALQITAHFPPPALPDIEMDVLVSVASVFSGHRGNHSYSRQVECPSCKGNGGLHGACRACSFCEGRGHAQHLLRDANRSYLHLASTTCHVCQGKGVHPLGSCPDCRGRGLVLQQETLHFSLPVGWRNQYRLQYPMMGHQRKRGGAVGGIILTFLYDFPPDWSVAPGGAPGDVQLTVRVPVERYTQGFTEEVSLLDGRSTEVRVDKVTDLMSITETTYMKKGCGLPKQQQLHLDDDVAEEEEEDEDSMGELENEEHQRTRKKRRKRRKKVELGDLYVTLTPVWDDTPATVWEHFLQDMIKNDNSTQSYNKMMNLFKLFGLKKARRSSGRSAMGGSAAGDDEEGDAEITLESAQ